MFDTYYDFKARSLVYFFLQLVTSGSSYRLLHSQERQCFLVPGIWFCYSFLLWPLARKSPRKPKYQLPWSLRRAYVSSHCIVLSVGGNPQAFYLSKFSRIWLKELNPDLISSMKSLVKLVELQSVNKGRIWLYMSMPTTELWNNSLQTSCLWCTKETQEWAK